MEAQLHMPADRPGLIQRPRLVDLLLGASDDPLIVLSAPVGYGKSTLLAQWATARRPNVRMGVARATGRTCRAAIHPHRHRRRACRRCAASSVQCRDARHLGHRSRWCRASLPHSRNMPSRSSWSSTTSTRCTTRTAKDARRSTGRQPAGPRPTRGVEPSARVAHDARQESPPRGLGARLVGSRPRTRRGATPSGDHRGGLETGRSGRHHVLDGGMARRCVPIVAGSASARNGVRPPVAPGRRPRPLRR